MADNHYDVIIIGSGAGGGTFAYRLAQIGAASPFWVFSSRIPFDHLHQRD